MAIRGVDPVVARRLGMIGLGVVGSAVTLGGLLWLIQRQLSDGKLIRVTLVHELDPETRALAARYEPSIRRMSEQGVDVNMRLFGRRREDEAEPGTLVASLAPASVAGVRRPWR